MNPIWLAIPFLLASFVLWAWVWHMAREWDRDSPGGGKLGRVLSLRAYRRKKTTDMKS
ncbi:hypothetical protein [Sulfobacillus harzensis]|uniref:Uncharacterized protein n=1 Tax=Sulfobacillus harzensis TaxID=2729629 RepID=A0A7Y0Q2W8_9FIRM|nr:hypothetical protein [Sulfobacillus harzensis]NMP21604.1 hypothetical protein [Sulfobacillus harzensis]